MKLNSEGKTEVERFDNVIGKGCGDSLRLHGVQGWVAHLG